MKLNTQNLDHFLGNPIFAIETNLDPLRKRITENRTQESLEIVDNIQKSLEKMKQVLAKLREQEC